MERNGQCLVQQYRETVWRKALGRFSNIKLGQQAQKLAKDQHCKHCNHQTVTHVALVTFFITVTKYLTETNEGRGGFDSQPPSSQSILRRHVRVACDCRNVWRSF